MNQEDIEFLEENGWIVECENPLEIRNNKTSSFATGYAAMCVFESLKNEENINKKEFKLNVNVREIMEEAFDTAEYPPNQEYRIEPNKYFCAKFTEIIIKEVLKLGEAEVIRFFDMDEWRLAHAVENYQEIIKEHFGIE